MARNKDLENVLFDWESGLADKPAFVDGLTHEKFYLVVAINPNFQEQAFVAIGKFGPEEFKVKMYPGFHAFNFTERTLKNLGHADNVLSRDSKGYQRYMTTKEGVNWLLETLPSMRGIKVCPVASLRSVFDIPIEERQGVAGIYNKGVRNNPYPDVPPMMTPEEQKEFFGPNAGLGMGPMIDGYGDMPHPPHNPDDDSENPFNGLDHPDHDD